MIRYCAQAGCGKPNSYTAVKPKYCSACGKPFDAAFAAVSPPSRPSAPVYEEPIYPDVAPTQRVYRDARGNDISERYVRQEPVRPQMDYEDNWDQNAARREARQLAASIMGSFQFEVGRAEKIRFDDLPAVQEAKKAGEKVSDKSGDEKPKRSRKK